MIGLSLSFCVKDIITGKVQEEDVEYIAAGTMCETPKHWQRVLKLYKETYWKEAPDRATEIVAKLQKAGKIRQPRLEGKPTPNISTGWWIR